MYLSWHIKNMTDLVFGLFTMITRWVMSTESHSKHLQLACINIAPRSSLKWCSSALCQDLCQAESSISFISNDYLIDCCLSMFISQGFKGVVPRYVIFLKDLKQSQQLTFSSVKEKQLAFIWEEMALETNQIGGKMIESRIGNTNFRASAGAYTLLQSMFGLVKTEDNLLPHKELSDM